MHLKRRPNVSDDENDEDAVWRPLVAPAAPAAAPQSRQCVHNTLLLCQCVRIFVFVHVSVVVVIQIVSVKLYRRLVV